MVKQRVGGVEFSYLPCLASGQNSNLTSDDMADLRRQGIAVDDENDPAPVTRVSVNAPRHRNSPYRHMVRWSIYNTI